MRHLERSKRPLSGTRILMMTSAVALMAASAAITAPAFADEAAAKKWIDSEFQPSTLSKDDQMKEMQWFIKAAAPFKGMEINAVSETLTVHEYESRTLAKAFEEITGIKVKHDIIQEGDVVEKLQTSMQSGKSIYDGWISDSDLIGTHYRYGKIMNLTDYMSGKGKEWTNPGLDIKDFIGTSFTTASTCSLMPSSVTTVNDTLSFSFSGFFKSFSSRCTPFASMSSEPWAGTVTSSSAASLPVWRISTLPATSDEAVSR